MGRMSFSLPANEYFILKFVFPDASKLFDVESVTQQEGPVLAAERSCPLLKATSSFLRGRHQSQWCSAAAGSLVCPLWPSLPLSSAPVAGAYSLCPLNLFSAYFAASVPSTNKDALPACMDNRERTACGGEQRCSSSILHMLSSLSLANSSPFVICPIYLPKYHPNIFSFI